jgi:hypothetical protein
MAYLVIFRHLAPGQITYLVSAASPILISPLCGIGSWRGADGPAPSQSAVN